jgi:hypothetical protein
VTEKHPPATVAFQTQGIESVTENENIFVSQDFKLISKMIWLAEYLFKSQPNVTLPYKLVLDQYSEP